MLSTWLLAGLCVFAFAMVSGRLERSIITAPMAFTAAGVLVGSWGLGLVTDEHAPFVHTLAEVTLILVLFTDAARMDLGLLKKEHDIPVRLLAIGMPLTIIAGAGLALIFFAELSWAEAAVLAAVLAPTDAALGQAVVSNPLVPTRIRQALNVESGLNDGIALPLILILLSVAGVHEAGAPGVWGWASFTLMQVTLGPLAGIAVGYVGGKGLEAGEQAHTITKGFRDLAVIALAFVAFAAAESIGGNGFIAAFVGGLTLGNTARDHCTCLYDFSESEGQLLTIATFAIFGAVMVPEALVHADLRVVGYTVASLTVVRMIPVALSLVGKGLGDRTVLFVGWFGPRGLATILFALLVVEEAALPHAELVVATAVCAVVASTILHGITAYPLASLYGAWAKARTQEHRPLTEMPLRVTHHSDQKSE